MFGIVDDEVEKYAFQHTTPLPPLLEEVKEATYKNMAYPQMISDRLIGGALQFIIATSGAKKVLELGTFTGFSALMMAHALPENGQIITCDIDPKAQKMAQGYFDRSPHGKKIEIRMGPALETLKTLTGPFDLVFIDADKINYTSYYEECLGVLSPNGIIAVDNTLWSGRVLAPKDEDDKAIASFNRHVQNDPRVVNLLLTIRDGLMLIRRK